MSLLNIREVAWLTKTIEPIVTGIRPAQVALEHTSHAQRFCAPFEKHQGRALRRDQYRRGGAIKIKTAVSLAQMAYLGTLELTGSIALWSCVAGVRFDR